MKQTNSPLLVMKNSDVKWIPHLKKNGLELVSYSVYSDFPVISIISPG